MSEAWKLITALPYIIVFSIPILFTELVLPKTLWTVIICSYCAFVVELLIYIGCCEYKELKELLK